MTSYAFDAASGIFIADEFGAGDASTVVSTSEFWKFPEASPGQGIIYLGNWSFVFDELYQPGSMLLTQLYFDTLQPGTAAFDLSYYMSGDGPYTNTGTATVNPVPVPEPSTLFLMLAGAPWALARMRRRAAN